ncbi:anti-sigma B factor antagonist [Streptomyces sp. V4I8]|uniref:STAS domain-containing protein n=1 Tax=Streptomyces sp. V4I8 TaxID=3156469 RepID=UPI003516BF52
MNITLSTGADLRQALVTVSGELDIATAEVLRDKLVAAVAVHEETVIDLAGLDFCDCTGIGTLVAAQNLARSLGHRLQTCRIPDHLQRLLQITQTRLGHTNPPPHTRHQAVRLGKAPGRTAA